MTIGPKGISHAWTGQKIMRRAPKASGVYAIFNDESWLYIGASGNLRASLIAHFDGEVACIRQSAPIGFQFEMLPPKQRLARKKQLIGELKPICNRR